MIAQLDVRAEKAIAEHAPNANLAAGLEDSKAVNKRLNSIRPKAKFAERTTAAPRSKLPVLGTAPDFTGHAALVQLAAPVAGGAARAGRADRLLDLHLHQLHPHAAVPEGVGRALPQRRADDRRRALA